MTHFKDQIYVYLNICDIVITVCCGWIFWISTSRQHTLVYKAVTENIIWRLH